MSKIREGLTVDGFYGFRYAVCGAGQIGGIRNETRLGLVHQYAINCCEVRVALVYGDTAVQQYLKGPIGLSPTATPMAIPPDSLEWAQIYQ